MRLSICFSLFLLFCQACQPTVETTAKDNSPNPQTEIRDFPSVFQAWYGIDMPAYPQNSLEERLQTASKHDLLWEEPLSQLGEGVDLVLGLVWDHQHHGLANSFTTESLAQAKANRTRLLELNPNMKLLLEVRWRDAPASFLPEDSEWWLRDESGEIVKGWLGGWEPFYMLNYDNPEFQDNVARQAKIALESGIYDGIMLDWSGYLEIIKKVRREIGEEGLIIVNIHDDIEDGKLYQPYINGSFMELNPKDDSNNSESNLRDWDNIREALLFFEANLREPRINCLEVWGDRQDLARMRATTTLGLTHSDGYVLYADPNPLKTPDHLHDWYAFWDAPLGVALGERVDRPDGAFERSYEGGLVLYNPYQNDPVNVQFDTEMKRLSTGEIGTEFIVSSRDGEIFLNL
ncbi:MAG: hypothetical protein AAGM67_11655 [Bacteroidota bacterium]